MDTEFDYQLTVQQWEMLKTLRAPAPDRRIATPLVLSQLLALGLAALRDDVPVITPQGRKVLVRGSEKLLDLAA